MQSKSFDDIYIKATGTPTSEGWELVQNIDIAESAEYIERHQHGSSKKRRIRVGGGYQCTVSQIRNDEDGVWDLDDTYTTLEFYHDNLFTFFKNIAIPEGTKYIKLTGCTIGDKRMGIPRDGDILDTVVIFAEGIDWNATL